MLDSAHPCVHKTPQIRYTKGEANKNFFSMCSLQLFIVFTSHENDSNLFAPISAENVAQLTNWKLACVLTQRSAFFFFCTYQFRASFLYAFFISSALAVRETPKISYGSSSAVSAFTSSKTRMMFRSTNTQLAAPNSRIALNPFNKSPRNNTLQRHDDALAAKGLGSLFYFSCSYFM